MEENDRQFDFDWLVIGSGFGGSVSALRLAEKGYRVAVLECGRRFRDEDFAEHHLGAARYYLDADAGHEAGSSGLTLFKDVFVVSGCGVGGGSLGYANTLYVAARAFFAGPAVGRPRRLGARAGAALRRGAADARRGRLRPDDAGRPLLKESRSDLGVGDTYSQDAGRVFFGEAGRDRPRPVLRRRGPGAHRLRAVRAAAWSAARYGAKNTLVKNYLYFAETPRRRRSSPERTVTDVRPLGAADGSDGYAVTHERSGRGSRRDRQHAARRAA